MSVFPLFIAESPETQDWGNCKDFHHHCCESSADRYHISKHIAEYKDFEDFVSRGSTSPRLAIVNSSKGQFAVLATDDVFIADKQCIDVKTQKTVLSSSASVYTSFYESGHYKDNALDIFNAERCEVLAMMERNLNSRHTCHPLLKGTLEKIPVFSTYSWSKNIQHFIIEGLTQLIQFDEFINSSSTSKSHDCDFVYQLPNNSFSLELGSCIFGEERVIARSSDHQYAYPKGIFLVPQQINFRPLSSSSISSISIIGRRLRESARNTLITTKLSGDNQHCYSETLFICRKPNPANTTTRCIANIDFVKAAMTERGIDVCHPEDLSITERLKIFPMYRNIIIEDGASIMNLLFASPKLVVIISHPLFNHNRAFFRSFIHACSGELPQVNIKWIDDALDFGVDSNTLWEEKKRFNLQYNIRPQVLGVMLDELSQP